MLCRRVRLVKLNSDIILLGNYVTASSEYGVNLT